MSLRIMLAALILAFAGAGSVARSAPLTPIRVGVIPAEVAAEAFYAKDMGFFERAGLDVRIEPFSNGPAIAAAVASGALDVGLSDVLSAVNAHARGLPFVFVAPAVVNVNTAAASTFAVLVRKDEPVRDARDLDGKTFGINGLNNIAQLVTDAWVDANGGDSRSLHWVEIPYPGLSPALEQGRVQALTTNEPWMTNAIDHGARPVFMERNALAPQLLLAGWLATTTWVRQKPAVAAQFVRAMRETAAWANAHHAESLPILAKYAKIPAGTIARMRRATFEESFHPGYVQPIIDAAAKYGLIPKAFPADEILLR